MAMPDDKTRYKTYHHPAGGWGAANATAKVLLEQSVVAKGSRAEKDRGLEMMPRRSGGEATGRVDGSAGTKNPRAGAGRNGGARNIHPTVKSIELMRWLVRLVAPRPGSLVLDPFAGSGTTGLGALAEGMRFLGFERDEDGVRTVRVTAWDGVEHRSGVPFPVFSPRLLLTLLREVRRADVVHVHDVLYTSSWVAALWALGALRRRG